MRTLLNILKTSMIGQLDPWIWMALKDTHKGMQEDNNYPRETKYAYCIT